MANSVDPDQTAPIGAVCSGSMLFASLLNSSVMLGNYLQHTNSADNIFRCIFILGTLRVNSKFLLKVKPVFRCIRFRSEDIILNIYPYFIFYQKGMLWILDISFIHHRSCRIPTSLEALS